MALATFSDGILFTHVGIAYHNEATARERNGNNARDDVNVEVEIGPGVKEGEGLDIDVVRRFQEGKYKTPRILKYPDEYL